MTRRPLFLARQSYRRRRLVDAARLLPLFGMVAFLLPLLWQGRGDLTEVRPAGIGTALGGLYIFAIWFGLILAAFLLGRALRDVPDEERDEGRDEG